MTGPGNPAFSRSCKELTMSLSEAELIESYWRETGGTLMTEFYAVNPSKEHGYRRLDAVIIRNGQERRLLKSEHASQEDLDGQDLLVIQAKRGRLGMNLLGQALFSRELMLRRFRPKTAKAIALCEMDDPVLRPIAEDFGIEIRIYG